MKNLVKAMMLIAFTSFGGWALTTETPIEQTKKADDKDVKKQAVRDLYLRNCARCHDADGKSQSQLGQSLGAPDLTSREVQKMSQKSIVKVITNGEEEMPAFSKKISKEEIKALAKYVRSFKQNDAALKFSINQKNEKAVIFLNFNFERDSEHLRAGCRTAERRRRFDRRGENLHFAAHR